MPLKFADSTTCSDINFTLNGKIQTFPLKSSVLSMSAQLQPQLDWQSEVFFVCPTHLPPSLLMADVFLLLKHSIKL